MITFKTKSGSTYKVDTANKKLHRVPNADSEHLITRFDDQWATFNSVSGLEVGCHALFMGAQVDYLQTTEITELTTE